MSEKVDVMMVDDDIFCIKLMERTLEPLNLVIKSFTDSEEALSSIGLIEPKILVLDLNLPNLNGDQLLVKLKKQTNWKNIIVFFVTGEDLVGEDLQLLSFLGAYRTFTKPLNQESFRKQVEEVLKLAI